MQNITKEFEHTINESYDRLMKISEAESGQALTPGKWARKQVIGHLIDSAANNHQRFIRAQLENNLSLPGYEQNSWVACQDYQNATWKDLLALWRSYNLHLVHVVSRIPEEKLSNVLRVGGGEEITLRFLIEDYVSHLKHHLGQALG